MQRSRFAHPALVMLLAVSMAAAGQTERKISAKALPPAVRESFEKQFPQARITGASEEKEAGGILYEIECRWKQRQYDVTFKPDGSLVSVEETIPVGEVPAAVMASLKSQFPTAEIKKAEKITEAGTVTYEFELRKSPKKEVKFSAEGKLLEAE